MSTARKPKPVMEAGIELDSLFRRQSKARVVAERLLTGRPLSRAQLVEGLDLSMTTVPRVVEVLEGAGIPVERTTDRSRQAVYKVVGTPGNDVRDPEHGAVVAQFSHTGGVTLVWQITKVEIVDGEVWVECLRSRSNKKVRGRMTNGTDGALNIPTSLLNGEAHLVGMCIFEDGDIGYRIGDDRHSVSLASVREI